jgi:hypothetical protein
VAQQGLAMMVVKDCLSQPRICTVQSITITHVMRAHGLMCEQWWSPIITYSDNQTEDGGQEGATPPTPTPPIDNQSGGVSTQIDSQDGESWSPEQQMVVLLISLMIISVLIGIMWSLFSREQFL